MMARTLWCKRCRVGYASVAGDIPAICPACEQPALWTTLQPAFPRQGFKLTNGDRAFLRSLRIQADGETAPADPTIAADDPA